MDEIARTVDPSATMVSAGCSSFNDEEYLRWSPSIYGWSGGIVRGVWSPDFWATRDTIFTSRLDYNDAERVYKDVLKDKAVHLYVPVRWTSEYMSEKYALEYGHSLIIASGRTSVPIYYFAIGRLDGRKYPYIPRTILYAKRTFLQTFSSGQDIINYHRMAVNFKKVYGFE